MMLQRLVNKVLVLAIAGLALASCSNLSTKVERTVFEKGKASWYGKRFHGRPTASGEIFDARKLTAAHPTLPFGTLVEVRSLTSGKSVVVRINDRGPFSNKRIIDLSHEAAVRLGMVQKGEDQVEVLVGQ